MAYYPNSYLRNVIIKADFAFPISLLKSELPQGLKSKIVQHFPISESIQQEQSQVIVKVEKGAEPQFESLSESVWEWKFASVDRKKHLLVTHEAVVVTVEAYRGYDALKVMFTDVVNELMTIFSGTVIQRLGLRFVNVIELDEPKPTDWSRYLQEKLLSVFDIESSEVLARVFHNVELNYGDYMLRFQFGMHNPDFPAPILKKIFVLDFDAYSEGAIEDVAEIDSLLARCHEQVIELFESCIKDELREKMR